MKLRKILYTHLEDHIADDSTIQDLWNAVDAILADERLYIREAQ